MCSRPAQLIPACRKSWLFFPSSMDLSFTVKKSNATLRFIDDALWEETKCSYGKLVITLASAYNLPKTSTKVKYGIFSLKISI